MFTSQVAQNQFLAPGADRVDAIITVAQTEDISARGGAAAGATMVFGALIDVSGSMSEAGKLIAAKAGLRRIIQLVPESARFFIVAGNTKGDVVVPLVPATAANKAMALEQVARLDAGGGTAISTWLEAARSLFPVGTGYIRTALLLTDGGNGDSDNARLGEVVRACEGAFQCECRGVGTNWQPDQLRLISHGLMGGLDIIPEASAIEADFLRIFAGAQSKQIAEAAIRVWVPAGAQILFCKQVSPSLLDLTAKGREVTPQIFEFPTGSWAREQRDYHLCVKVKPGAVGQKMLAARVQLVFRTGATVTESDKAQILAIWTDDETRTAVIDRSVAHYTNQGELAQMIQEGLQARRDGNDEEATRKLGRAVQLAAETENDETTRLLRRVVEVIDEDQGTVRLKRNTSAEDEMTLDTRSTRTTRSKPG